MGSRLRLVFWERLLATHRSHATLHSQLSNFVPARQALLKLVDVPSYSPQLHPLYREAFAVVFASQLGVDDAIRHRERTMTDSGREELRAEMVQKNKRAESRPRLRRCDSNEQSENSNSYSGRSLPNRVNRLFGTAGAYDSPQSRGGAGPRGAGGSECAIACDCRTRGHLGHGREPSSARGIIAFHESRRLLSLALRLFSASS